jgi:phospholipid-binding lipoprotein MlaA
VRNILGLIAATALAASLAGAATAAPADNADPWEGLNRGVYKLNKGFDRAVGRPVSMGYRRALSKPVRHGVHNALYNLNEPLNTLNFVLQARPEPAARSLGRFAINSTFGLLGVMDVAGASGIPYQDTDFGLTLARWSVPSGPYLVIPVYGPSSLRDAAGKLADTVISPFNWWNYDGKLAVDSSIWIADGIDDRVAIDPLYLDVQRNSLDPYATIRSAYQQNRAKAARGDAKEDVQALPDFDSESAPAPAKPPTAAPAPKPAPEAAPVTQAAPAAAPTV